MAEHVEGQQPTDPTGPAAEPVHRGRRIAAVVAVGAGVLAIAVPLTLAARHQSASPAAEAAGPAPTPAVPPEMTPPELSPSEQQAIPPRPTATVSGAVKGRPGWAGCPAREADLLKALRTSDLGEQLGRTRQLTDVDCYELYALARTANADPATVIFRFVEVTESWQVVGGGRPAGCAKIPEAVRTHLRHCP